MSTITVLVGLAAQYFPGSSRIIGGSARLKKRGLGRLAAEPMPRGTGKRPSRGSRRKMTVESAKKPPSNGPLRHPEEAG